MAKKKWKKKEKRESAEKILNEGDSGKNKNIAIGAVILILIAGYYFLSQSSSPNVPTPPPVQINGIYELFSDKSSTHVKGRITLMEFFDFYCSHCFNFHKQGWPALKSKYGDKILLVDLGYPLRESSELPIEAYEIAKDLGRGEEMKDAIFSAIHDSGRDDLTVEELSDIAESVGLDRNGFGLALESRGKSKIWKENRRLGNSYKLQGTPMFVIDGNIKVLDNSIPNIEAIIDSTINQE